MYLKTKDGKGILVVFSTTWKHLRISSNVDLSGFSGNSFKFIIIVPCCLIRYSRVNELISSFSYVRVESV